MSDIVKLAGYELQELLGRGTMGSVYLARSCVASSQPPNVHIPEYVAIKRVTSLGTAEDRSRLRREAETMARLDHPNIVRILDVVDDGDGIALVMAYALEGTLARRIKESQGMSPDAVVAIIAPIADALATAHGQGILHRDVKPSNILFTANGHPLLADFGIARNAAQTNLTSTNMAMGTAGYLDPDLADGIDASPESDQYALGVVAYEALTGHPPYDATSSPLAVLRAADRGAHEVLDPGVYGPIAKVIERAFARQSVERFVSLEAFAAALRNPDSVVQPRGPVRVAGGPPAEVPPELADATRAFRRRVTPASLAEATPVVPQNTRRRYKTIGLLVCALGIFAGALFINSQRTTSLKSLGPHPFPACNVQTTAQCVKSAVRTAKGIQIVFENESRGNYTIGESTDALVVGNWFCGSRATLAIYRPRTGVVYYFNNWPDPDGGPTTALVDSTKVLGAQLAAGDHNNDKCADIALDVDGTRTWFLPHVQPQRLRNAPAPAVTGAAS